MTAIMMGAAGSAAVTLAALETTVTIGADIWFTAGTADDYFVWGFNDANADPLNIATIGSISDDTYLDGGTTSRTVATIFYSEDTGGIASAATEDTIWFGLVGTSIPNTDTTFREIVYNGQTYVRSAADTYDASVGGQTTFWRWNNVSPNGPTSGFASFEVIL